jgi:hypothetical protein
MAVTCTRVDGGEVSGAGRSECGGRRRGEGRSGDEDDAKTLIGGGRARPGGDSAGFEQQRRTASDNGGVRLQTTAATQRSDTAIGTAVNGRGGAWSGCQGGRAR